MHNEFEIQQFSIRNKIDWNNALSGIVTSVYFCWDYLAPLSLNYNADVNLIKISNKNSGVIAFYTTRTKDNHVYDAYSPYALDGVYFWGKEIDNVFKQLIEFFRNNNIITYYLTAHPGFQKNNLELFQSNRTLYHLNIHKNIDDLWKGLHPNHRYEINKFTKSGYEIITDKYLLIESFIQLYQKTTERVNASSSYLFSNKTLYDLNQSDITLTLGAVINSKVECVVMFLFKDNWAEYFINASSEIGRQTTRALIWEGIKQLKSKGVTEINLGGGVSEGDHLDQFKRRFGGIAQKLLLLKGIASNDEYQRLCTSYNVSNENNNYFPPYWSK